MFIKRKPHAGCQNHTPGNDRMVPSAAAWHYLQWECSIPSLLGYTAHFCPGGLDLSPLTLTFKPVQARDQTHLPCEFGANAFSRSRDIWFTNRKVTNSAKNRTLLACGNKRQRLSNIADLTCKKQHFIIRDVSSNIADLTCKKQHFIIHDVSGRRLASLAQDCNALYSHPPSTLMDHCKACRQTTFNHTSSSN